MSVPDASAAIEIASTLQSASIVRSPSPTHDINPPTAAESRIPVKATSEGAEDVDDLIASDVDDDDDDISVSLLKPIPRKNNLPPLPDLRFEQSYLTSIAGAESWQGVAWITIRDQVLIALAQGFLTSLAFAGWKHWNQNANMSGNSVGARIRRWWYRTNNWPIKVNKDTLRDKKLAREIGDHYAYKQ